MVLYFICLFIYFVPANGMLRNARTMQVKKGKEGKRGYDGNFRRMWGYFGKRVFFFFNFFLMYFEGEGRFCSAIPFRHLSGFPVLGVDGIGEVGPTVATSLCHVLYFFFLNSRCSVLLGPTLDV